MLDHDRAPSDRTDSNDPHPSSALSINHTHDPKPDPSRGPKPTTQPHNHATSVDPFNHPPPTVPPPETRDTLDKLFKQVHLHNQQTKGLALARTQAAYANHARETKVNTMGTKLKGMWRSYFLLEMMVEKEP